VNLPPKAEGFFLAQAVFIVAVRNARFELAGEATGLTNRADGRTLREGPRMTTDQTERVELYSRFVQRYGQARWNETTISRPIPEHKVAVLQQRLGLVFPESLRLFLRNHGDVAVPELSRTWLFADDRTCLVPIEEFFGYDSMPLANQKAWLAPIPASISGGRALSSANAFDYLVSFLLVMTVATGSASNARIA